MRHPTNGIDINGLINFLADIDTPDGDVFDVGLDNDPLDCEIEDDVFDVGLEGDPLDCDVDDFFDNMLDDETFDDIGHAANAPQTPLPVMPSRQQLFEPPYNDKGSRMKIPKSPRPKPDEVDRAVSGVRSAIAKLARQMQTDNKAVRLKAAAALLEIGPYAGGPLAMAASRAPVPGHRLYMLGLLRSLGSAEDPDVVGVLAKMREDDPNEMVARVAGVFFSQMVDKKLVEMVETSAEAYYRKKKEEASSTG